MSKKTITQIEAQLMREVREFIALWVADNGGARQDAFIVQKKFEEYLTARRIAALIGSSNE